MKRREPLTPDLTPIIDVVFLILIFFLVSSTFKKDELALMLTLPKSDQATIEIEKQEISLELSQEEIAIKGKKIDFKTLDLMLSKEKQKDKPINVRIQKDVKYERIIKLFDILKKYDLNNLALETKK
jgi:biopolymer transport protein ExbD